MSAPEKTDAPAPSAEVEKAAQRLAGYEAYLKRHRINETDYHDDKFPVAEHRTGDITTVLTALTAAEAQVKEMREVWTRIKRAADLILAEVTGKAGRYMYDAPDAEALGALLSAVTWRPISEAPKDGTSILGSYFNQPWAESHREGRVVKCWWQPEFEAFISGCREMTMAPGYTFDGKGGTHLHSPDIESVTHFLPLPPPPEAK